MQNAKLIDGLRWCADESICCDDFSGEKCPYFDEKKDSCSVDEILHAAADALEADEQRVKELESQSAFFDAEKLNYQENIEYRDERIKELEAQLLKQDRNDAE